MSAQQPQTSAPCKRCKGTKRVLKPNLFTAPCPDCKPATPPCKTCGDTRVVLADALGVQPCPDCKPATQP